MDLPPALERRFEEAALNETALAPLLIAIADYLGAEEATLGGGSSGQITAIAPRTDPGRIDTYFATYHQQNAIMRRMLAQPRGKAVALDGFEEFDSFRRSDFYNAWCRPQGFNHAAGLTLSTITGWRGALVINMRGDVRADHVARLQMLAPHISRTIETSQLLAQLGQAHQATLDVLEHAGKPALLLSGGGHVMFVNALAGSLIERQKLCLINGRIASRDDQDRDPLALAVRRCIATGSGGTVQMTGPGGTMRLRFEPFPGAVASPSNERPAVIAVVEDQGERLLARIAQLRDDHGLSPAEAALVEALVQSGSRKAAAAVRKVSDSTARAQLTSIFDKTGVRRQTELIRLLMSGD